MNSPSGPDINTTNASQKISVWKTIAFSRQVTDNSACDAIGHDRL